jgi:chemotaxis protein methyltransferase CheR
VIFFRNALIYFTAENRLTIMDALAESLYHDGLLFLGISETSSVRHPLLINRYLSNVFYFQKISPSFYYESERKSTPLSEPKKIMLPAAASRATQRESVKPVPLKKTGIVIDCKEVASILETQDGNLNAKKVLETLSGESRDAETDSLSGAQLAASVTVFLSAQDFSSADLVLSALEKNDSTAVTLFLRGEYNFLTGNAAEAEKKFGEAAGKDKAFWPAFYRLSSIAAQGNRTRYEYRIKKACESLELGKEMRYECFLGGFSPDYFHRILEKKLT